MDYRTLGDELCAAARLAHESGGDPYPYLRLAEIAYKLADEKEE